MTRRTVIAPQYGPGRAAGLPTGLSRSGRPDSDGAAPHRGDGAVAAKLEVTKLAVLPVLEIVSIARPDSGPFPETSPRM